MKSSLIRALLGVGCIGVAVPGFVATASGSQLFASASSQRLTAGQLIGSRPCSISFWANLTTITGLPIYWATGNAGATSSAYLLINNTISNAVILVDGGRNVTSSNTVSAGALTHIVAVFNSDTSRTIWVNNTATNGAADSLTFDFSASTQSSIGAYDLSGVSGDFTNGTLSEFVFYNVALTASDVASLFAKASPLVVRPSAIVNYYPLVGGILNGWNTSAALTNVNASTGSSDGPGIVRFRR